ncbi:hypothetical protein OKW96_13460 [Sphingobacterium sp. KU25419]|nr:hypothetical protein OKW96_13460 [Sphingobacterium sp. KU25419]
MKPLSPEAHQHLADWVKSGGVLLYSGTDLDPFQTVQEWWNTKGNHYTSPADHLFEKMNIEESQRREDIIMAKVRCIFYEQIQKIMY